MGIRVTAVAPGAFRTDFLDPHSVRKGSRTAKAPAATGAALAALDGMAGRQVGDPERAASAFLRPVESPNPRRTSCWAGMPSNRFQASRQILAAQMNAWEAVTRSTDRA